VVQLATRQALRRAKPDRAAYQRLLPLDGAHSVYAYTENSGADRETGTPDIQARMFTGRMTEDPATGSATSAMAALFAHVRGTRSLDLNVAQGVDMGRPSVLAARARDMDGSMRAYVGGQCVRVMDGALRLGEDERRRGGHRMA
jgi:trans-2,3-dihydro-3-hydroxyanthranilate isomerase